VNPGEERIGGPEPVSVVRAFYQAVSTGDADAVRSLVRERFADDAVFHWPESLPYGGSVSGRAKLERVLGGAAAATEPVGVRKLQLACVIDGGDRVVAQLEFDWYAPDETGFLPGTGAVEVWTFAGGQVSEIKAYYWDTAACMARYA